MLFPHQHHPVSAAVQEDEYLKERERRAVNVVSNWHLLPWDPLVRKYSMPSMEHL